MSDFNVIDAHLTGRTVCTTKTVYQYSRGMELHIYDNGLPDNYRVEFANSVTGTSTGQLCTDGVVSVPTQYFVPGSTIYAWVVMVSAEYDVPIKTITIPIAIKAQYVDAEPAPEPTSIIDEAIAALNTAVTEAEAAVQHYPKVEGGYWMVWDVNAGAYVSTGVPAQGPTGDSGVYVGETEPTNPDVNVWIDPSGTSVFRDPVVVEGSTPTIIGEKNISYECGELASLTLQAPATGDVEVFFTSGSTPTVLTVTSAKSGVEVIKWANGWAGTCEANTVYDIIITHGEYGVVASWAS